MASISAMGTPSLPLITTTPLPTTSDGTIPIIDHPDVDNANCRLLGPFALVVQALMGILVMGTLVWKRQREKPRRPWKIWILDITKQMLGQLFVHTLNVLLSNFVANVGEQNPCSLYFLNILIDTTLGVFIIYLTLRITTHVLTDVLGWTGFVSGHYSERIRSGAATASNGERSALGASAARSKPRGKGRGSRSRPKLTYWLKQLGMYFFALLVMKVIVTILFVIFPFLFAFGRWLLGLFGSAKNAQVLFVMCLFPLAMNTLQFWLVDSFLRHDPDKSKYGPGRSRTNGSGDISAGAGDDSAIPAWDLNGGANGTRRRHLPEYEHDYEYEHDHDEEDREVGRASGTDTPSEDEGPVRRHQSRPRGAEVEETRLVIGEASDDEDAEDKAAGPAGMSGGSSSNEARARRRGPAGGTYALNLDPSRSASPPIPSPTSSSSSRSRVHSSVLPRSKQSSRSSSPLSAAVMSKNSTMSRQGSEGGHAYPPTGSGTLPSIEGQEAEDNIAGDP